LFEFYFTCVCLSDNRQSCLSVCKVIRQIAASMENGEYDFDGTPEKRVSLLT